MMVSVVKVFLSIVVLFRLVSGQFPAACQDNANIVSKTCCPSNCSGHGICTDISGERSVNWALIMGYGRTVVDRIEKAKSVYGKIDTRYQWPTEVFTRVCVCDERYGGVDCSECDFGYIMNSKGVCKKSSYRIRKNYLRMTQQEKKYLTSVLNEAKNEDPSEYKWSVVVEEPDNVSESGLRLQRVSTYDLFVYHHFLAKREGGLNEVSGPVCRTDDLDLSVVDFAHEGPSFLTWHRYYLLLIEREFGRIAERIGSPLNWNRYTFTLPYWDWRGTKKVRRHIFHPFYFGTFTKGANRSSVSGILFDNDNWPTVCDIHYAANTDHTLPVTCADIRETCNVQAYRNKTHTGHLERGRFILRGQNELANQTLPDFKMIQYLYCTDVYDAEDRSGQYYGITSSGRSFRNRLEGFVDFKSTSKGTFEDYGSGSTHNNFHNSGHIYIYGEMMVVPPASNDPIFHLHHCNVDRIFETWLRRQGKRSSFVPESRVAHPGHNGIDYLVPFFPLKTNSDMYKGSRYFGYDYQQLAIHQSDSFECPSHST